MDHKKHPGALDGIGPRPTQNQTPDNSLSSPIPPLEPQEPTLIYPEPHHIEDEFPGPQQIMEDVPGPSAKWRRGWFTRKRLIIIGVILALLVGAGLLLSLFFNNLIVKNTGETAVALQDQVEPIQLKGEGDGRINILLIGIGGELHKAGDLSDTIILLSIDPFAKTAALLSVPRDLYLEIPDFGYSKINAAHAYGEQNNYPGGGPALLKKTLAKALDVPIHYYVRVDFEGFKEAINIVGGIDIYLDQDLDDPSYPDERLEGYDHFSISKGQHHINGETALKLARSRYTTSDFDRSKRQQKIMLAFKNKVLSLNTLSNPVKVARMMNSMSKNIKTDLKLEEIMRLSEIAKEVKDGQVTTNNLDTSPNNYLAFSNIYGQSALVPKTGDFSEIQRFVRSLLVDGYIKKEQARITILNGTLKAGLGTKAAEILRGYGYKVVKVDNAPEQNYAQTVIYDHSSGSKPYTTRYLEQRFGVTAELKLISSDEIPSDITIILGQNYRVEE